MGIGDNGDEWAEAARANGLDFATRSGDTPDLVGTKGASRVLVECVFEEKSESENGGRVGYWYPRVSLYFAEPLLIELKIEDTDFRSNDPRRVAALFKGRDASGSSPKERIAAMLDADQPGRRVIGGDDERITCALHPTWGSVLGGSHSLSAAGISWALSELAPIVEAIDAAHAKLGAPSWIDDTRKRWRGVAERRDLELDERDLEMRSTKITCWVEVESSRRTTTIRARFSGSERDAFKIAGTALRGPWEHRLARLFHSKTIPSTGDDAFDRRFDVGGSVPRGLLGRKARKALVMLHRESVGQVHVSTNGLSVTFDGIPETEDLDSFLDAAESVVDSVKS